jgi:hypothetical protein
MQTTVTPALSPDEQQQQRMRSYRRRLRSARWWVVARSLIVILGGGLFLIVVGFWLPSSADEPWRTIADLAIVAWFSGFVAYAELVSRYLDSPARLVGAPPTPFYLLINMAAGIAALLIVKKLGIFTGTKAPRLYAILLAGFGAIAFFRSSLFTVRVGDTDVGIGPSALLQSLLSASDRMIDRDQAQGRATDVAGIMRDVDFDKARASLPSLCFLLVENITPADQEGVGGQIKRLAAAADVSPDQKAIILGVYLIRQVGADVLDLAVQALGIEIRKPPPRADIAPEHA